MLYYPPPEHTTDMSNGSIPRRPGRPRKPENSNDADMLMRVSNLICLAAITFLLVVGLLCLGGSIIADDCQEES